MLALLTALTTRLMSAINGQHRRKAHGFPLLCAIAGVMMAGLASAAQAANITFTFSNSGSNLVLTYSGTLGSAGENGGYLINTGAELYQDLVFFNSSNSMTSTPHSFTLNCTSGPCLSSNSLFSSLSGGTMTGGSAGSSSEFWLYYSGSGEFLLPSNWAPNNSVSGTITWSGRSVAQIGGPSTSTYAVGTTSGLTGDTITVVVAGNTNLSNLTLSSGTLTPTFSSGTVSYTAQVANSVSSITVTPTVADNTSTVKVNGSTVTSGSPSGPIALAVGTNTITTVVTAQDLTTKTYTTTVTRLALPTITAVAPSAGPTAGGTSVVITGTNFTGASSVTFGSNAASFVVDSPTQITATAPAGSAGAANVSVTTAGGTATSTGAYSYVASPTLSSASPPYGPTGGGISITLSGTDLSNATSVKFGNNVAAITYNTATQINATLPAGSGTVNVVVTTAGGTATLVNGFSYSAPAITAVNPPYGPTAGGISVTIDGTNFGGVTGVSFGGTAGTITLATDTRVVVTAPARAAGVVNVSLTTPSGTATANNAFTYQGAPTVIALSPNAGTTAGGQSVVISGTGFTGATAVSFGGTAATSYTVDSDTQITAITPAKTAGTVDVAVTTSYGTGTGTGVFTFVGAPTLSTVVPASGTTAGGTSVVINGTELSTATVVSFGGTPAASFTVNSATQIVATAPAGSAGAVDVGVTTAGGSASLVNAFTYVAAPAITFVSPNSGPTAGGQSVIISGSGLGGATAVSFDGTSATFTVNSATQITVTTPAHAVGAVNVSVTTPGGTVTSNNAFTYVAAPAITTVTPASGATAGGDTVVIDGSGFTGATVVAFGGTPAPSYTINSATRITATTPAGSAGLVNVSVTTAGGTSTSSNAFTYVAAPVITSVTPGAGVTAGGDTVVIAGSGFTGATAVTFGTNAAASYTVDSATQITATTPAGAVGQVNVSVTTAGGTSTSNNAFTYAGVPAITGVSPSTGATAGGDTIVITGTSLAGATAVSFGGTPAAGFTVNSATQVTATTPAGSAGAVNISVTTAGGTATSNNAFTYVSAPVIIAVSPNSGTTTGGDTVTITGTGFTGATAVSFGSTAAASFTVNSPTQITAVTPAGSAGAASVSVTTAGGAVTSNGAFTYTVSAPTIAGISPNSGTTTGGDTVTITGTGFTGATAVSFGSTAAASFAVNSATQITAVTPAGSAGAVNVSVTTAGGTATSTGAFTYTVSAPTIAGVSPNTGLPAGGDTVTITGTGFTGATAVSFGNAAAASFTVNSATQITAVTPASVTGTVSVSVTTAGGTATSNGAFTYAAAAPTVSSVTPNLGSAKGGDTVTITGTNFGGATAVSFGGMPAARFTVVSPTQISAVTPAGASGAVDVSVTTAGGTAPLSSAFTYVSQTPKDAFDESKGEIRRIVQEQAQDRLSTLMGDNLRMMQDARSRFIGFAGGAGDGNAALLQNGFDAIAFDVDGTADLTGDLRGIVAASSGTFLGQTGMVNGANWRVSGNFDVLLDGDQSLASIDGRVAREQFISRNILWGAFGGGQFSSSEIADSFDGSETTWQLYAGTYAVTKLTRNLFADAYASAGYGWSDLSMSNDLLSLDSNYGTVTWQVGGSLSGLIEMDRFSLLPTLSLAYGNSDLGQIDFTAQAYGLTDGVGMDAGHVAMGELRLTPEMRIPFGSDGTATDGVVLGLLPSFICQQLVADEIDNRCGWGVGLELLQQDARASGQFSGRVDFEQIGGVSHIGGQIGYSVQF